MIKCADPPIEFYGRYSWLSVSYLRQLIIERLFPCVAIVSGNSRFYFYTLGFII